jgi:NADH dehydrogenase
LARADVSDDASIGAVVRGAFGVVNALSLYVEQGGQTFHSVHVEAAARLAMHSKNAGVARLIHVSGIGADAASRSPYIQSRGEGENAVRSAFPAATIIRPAVMFGPDDAFLIPLIKLLRRSPIFPMFGRGRTALQPAYVEDVAEAVARTLDASQAQPVYELGGPHIYTYEDLLRAVGVQLGSPRVLLPVPFAIWQALASLAEHLPRAPITRNQVELMRIDNVASPACAGFGALGIEPHGIEMVLEAGHNADQRAH